MYLAPKFYQIGWTAVKIWLGFSAMVIGGVIVKAF